MERKDLTGMVFGKLTVIEMLYNYNGTKRTKCLCRCECGNECVRDAYTLRTSELSSCGCGRKEYIQKRCGKDIDGMTFGRLTVLETYWNMNPPRVKCKCECGNTVILRKNDVQHLHTQSCGCLQKERASKANEVDHTGKISNYGIKVLNKYKQNDLGQWIWECECGLCNKHFYDIPARVLNGHVRSCGCLKQSSNEIFISKILDELNVQYVSQYKFDDCKSDKNYPLYFDFAIFKDDNLSCLIEYDGAQHFFSNDLFAGEKGFQETRKRDMIKDDYCKNNNITLYRFPYTMTNEEIKNKIMNIIYP